jgi:GTP-binding nuclear protein Ran
MESFKIIIAGDAGTGKTSYVARLLGKDFTQRYDPTFGVDVHPVSFTSSDPTCPTICFNVWDTAGQERFSDNAEAYYKGASAAFLFLDVTSVQSLENIKIWRDKISKVNKTIPFVICANKVDIKRQSVKPEDIAQLGLPFYEISVKSGENVVFPFQHVASGLNRRSIVLSSPFA